MCDQLLGTEIDTQYHMKIFHTFQSWSMPVVHSICIVDNLVIILSVTEGGIQSSLLKGFCMALVCIVKSSTKPSGP